MNIDDWLDRNTFRCARLSARLSPAQCAFNRQGLPDDDGTPFIIPACRDCPDWIVSLLAAPRPQAPATPQGFDFWSLQDPGRPRLPARLRPTALAGSTGFLLTSATSRRFGLRKYRSVRLFPAPDGWFVAQFLKRQAPPGEPFLHRVQNQENGLRLEASDLVLATGAFGRYEVEGGNVPEPVLTLRPLAAPTQARTLAQTPARTTSQTTAGTIIRSAA